MCQGEDACVLGEDLQETYMEVPAGAVPPLPYCQQAASVILQKTPVHPDTASRVHSLCKAAQRGLFHALRCL